jgi:hypothetical protein
MLSLASGKGHVPRSDGSPVRGDVTLLPGRSAPPAAPAWSEGHHAARPRARNLLLRSWTIAHLRAADHRVARSNVRRGRLEWA